MDLGWGGGAVWLSSSGSVPSPEMTVASDYVLDCRNGQVWLGTPDLPFAELVVLRKWV